MPDYSNTRLQFRRGTYAEWAAANPILASGEPGYDITNKILKVGDGATQFASLSGITGGGGGGGGGSTTFTGLLDSPSNFTSSAGLVVKVNSAASSLEFGGIDIVTDTSPQLGGNLDLNSKNITGTGDIDLQGTIDSNGAIQGSSIKRIGGTSSQFLKADGSVDSNSYLTSALSNVVEDTTPQLGGTLDTNSQSVTGGIRSDTVGIDLDSAITNGTPLQVYDFADAEPFFAVRAGSAFISAIFGPSTASANCRTQYYSSNTTTGNYWRQDASQTTYSLTRVDGNSADDTVFSITNSATTFTGNVGVTGIITGTSLVKSGGTSSEFLKADGSVDTNTYLTSEADTLANVTGRGATTTTTSVIPFYYANQSAFPSATTYHGAIAHSHSDGAMYFAHGGSWNKLANQSEIDSVGYLTSVSGITVSSFDAAAIVTESEDIASNDNDSTLPTSAAVKDYIDTQLGGGGMYNLVEDTTPQLGGDLDLNGFEINGSGVTKPILRQDGNDLILNSTGGELFLRGGDADLSYQVEIATTYAKFADNRFQILASETVLNQSGASVDFRVEGDTNVNLLFADASADKVGIGTSTPSTLLHVAGSATASSFVVPSGLSTQFLKADGSLDTSTYLTSFTETNDLSASVTWANVPDANVTESSVTQHQAALTITESQISDLGHTSEVNDLSSSVTWVNVPDANITQGSVTQHQAALSITESQISDLQSYLTSETFTSVVQDTTPQLGGTLDAQSNNITGVGTLGVNGGATFEKNLIVNNAGSATSSDFQVKGDNDTHLLFTDAANDKVGIGTATPAHKLDVAGMGRFVHADGACGLQVEDTGGSGLHIGDCALGSLGTYAGIKHSSHGSSDYMMISNGITTFVSAVNNGAVILRGGGNDSNSEIQVKDVGAGAVGIIFNEAGADRDIRMEGDTDENLFYVDASTDRIGIGTATPAQVFDVSTVETEIAGFNGQTSSDPVASGNLQSLIIESKSGAGAKGIYLKHMCNESNGSSALSMKNVIRMGEGIISLDDAYTTGLSTTYYPKLQVNTETGAVTFNDTYTFPTADGSADQVLKTDGAGNISFGTLSTTNLDTTNFSAATIVTEAEGIGSNDNDTTLPTSAAVKDYADTKIASNTSAVSNSVAVSNIVMITQTNYDALSSYDANTLYFIIS